MWDKKHVKRMVSYFIFGLICFILIFIGTPFNPISNMGGSAIEVEGQGVSFREYINYVDQLRSQSSSAAGGASEAERQNQFHRQAIEALVQRELILNVAGRLGLQVSDREVGDYLTGLEVFQEEGRFQRSRYLSFLSARSFSASYFEDLIRKQLKEVKLRSFFDKSVFTSRWEQEKQEELKEFEVEVSYVRFKWSDFDLKDKNHIENLVVTGEVKAFQRILKEKGLQWEKTGDFGLNRLSLPGLSLHKNLFEEVVGYLPRTGFIPRVFYSRGEVFLLRVDKFQNRIQKDKPGGERNLIFASRMASHQLFFNWINFVRKNSHIKLHPRIVSAENPASL